jgi:acetyl-CoA carboxylase carboxyltransferase component
MALRLRIPVIYLVDSSGLFLPEQSLSFPGKHGAGHIFQRNAILSAEGVPQIAGVFGDCIAGGGYMPIISDRVFMTEAAYMVIAGAALIKGAKAQQLTSLDIGGPEVHVHQSGCADDRVPDDATCIAFIQREIEKLPTSAVDYYRFGADVQEPLHSPSELYGLFPVDHRHSYDVKEVMARLVDGSVVHEFLPHTGKEIYTIVARVSGLWVGFACNVQEPQLHPDNEGLRPGGILYREGISKLAAFSRACNDDGIPLFWMQDIAGFDIGLEAESLGLLGYGSSLIYSNSTNTAPVFTVLLRKASGAGYYAMAGLPYEPIVQLATTFSRLSVMEGRTLSIAAYRTKLDENFEIESTDPAEREAIAQGMKRTAERIEKDMDPTKAAAQMDTDEIICLDELRTWLCLLAECSYQSIGYRRIKNPRIWSIHDQNILCKANVSVEEGTEDVGSVVIQTKEGNTAIHTRMPGTFWTRPSPDSALFIEQGASIVEGQTVALVEVMKTFSAITATASGTFVGWEKLDGASISPSDVLGWIETDVNV